MWSLSSFLVRVGAVQGQLPGLGFQGRCERIHQGVARDPFMSLLESGIEHSSTMIFSNGTSKELSGLSEDSEAREHPKLVLPTVYIKSRVSAITLHGPLGITFPLSCTDIDTLLRATAQSLNTLRLTNLSFSQSQWEDALTVWKLPLLKTLMITEDTDELSFPFLSAFLDRHTSLHDVDIQSMTSTMCSIGVARPRDSAVDQSQIASILYHISSTLCHLVRLVDSPTSRIVSLHTVTVDLRPCFEAGDFTASDQSTLTSLFALLGQKASNLRTLRVLIPSVTGAQTWLSLFRKSSAGTLFMRASGLASSLYKKGRGESSSHSKSLGAAIGTLTQLQTLHIMCEAESDEYHFIPPSHIIELLAAFPSVRVAYIDNAFRYTSTTVTGVSQRTISGATLWKELSKVWGKCSGLQRLEIRGAGTVNFSWTWNRGDANPMLG